MVHRLTRFAFSLLSAIRFLFAFRAFKSHLLSLFAIPADGSNPNLGVQAIPMVIILASGALYKGSYFIPVITGLANLEFFFEFLIIEVNFALVLFDDLVNLGQYNLGGGFLMIFP